MEFGGDWVSKPFEKIVDDARKLQMLQLAKEAQRLSTEAETSRATIAEANARAEEANQKAETERLERVKLETKIAPRWLNDEQRQKLISELLSANIGPISVISYGDLEPRQYADQFSEALRNAGLLSDRVTSRSNGTVGVAVYMAGVHALDADALQMDPLVSALRKADISVGNVGSSNIPYRIPDALGRPTPAWQSKPEARILIIGEKPLSP